MKKVISTYKTLANKQRKNTFCLNFNGVGVSNIGGRNFYAKLKNLEVLLDGEYREAEYSTTSTINGSKIGAGDQISYSGEYDSCDITPKLGFELGLDIAKPFDGLVETFGNGKRRIYR